MSHILKSNIKQETLAGLFAALREFQLDDIFDTSVLGRAYEYADSIELVASDDVSISAEIGSSSVYTLLLAIDGSSVVGSCSCPYDGKCKHLAALMLYGLRR